MGRPRLRDARRLTFVRDTLHYTGGSFVGQFSQVVYAVVLRRILAPALMGLWDFVSVVQNFALSFDVGTGTAAAIEMPVLRGAGRSEQLARVRATAVAAAAGQGALMAAAIVLYALVANLSPGLRTAAFVAAVVVFVYSIQDALTVVLQTNESFVALSRVTVTASVAAVVLLPAGAALGGIDGLYVAAIAALVLRVLLLYRRTWTEGVAPKGRPDRAALTGLVRLGFPLRLADLPQGLFSVFDVVLVTRYLGVEGLALYSTARLVFVQAANLPGYAANVFVMRAFRLSGASVPRARLGDDARSFVLLEYAAVLPILAILVVHGLAFLTDVILVGYGASVDVLTVLVLALFFVPQTTMIRNFWMVDRRIVALGVSNAVGLATQAAGLWLAIGIWGSSLTSIATGTVAGYAGYFLYMMATIGRELWGARTAMSVAAHAFAGAATTAAAIALIPPASGGGGVIVSAGEAAWNAALSVAILLPLAAYGVHRSGALPRIRGESPAEAGSRPS